MTNTQAHAKRELELLAKTTPDAIITPFTKELLALCEKFGKSGQSGGSAPYTAKALSQAVEALCLQEPICPIMGSDDEWVDVSEMSDGAIMFQNKRDGRIFKDSADGKAYFIEAIVFNGDISGGFTGKVLLDGKEISSSQHIKSFPFQPKTFYVDVKDYRWKDKEEKQPDPNGDWWTHTIKDKGQLKEVFEYYDQK